jgi:hypothetical protein
MSDKKREFIAFDEQFDGGILIGDIPPLTEVAPGALQYLWSYLAELADGESYEVKITRRDMTQEEIDSALVI